MLKLSSDIMSKLFQTFQSPHSLHKPPHPYCFTLPSSHEFCGQIFENIFFSLDLLVQKIFFDKNHWFQLLSPKNDWTIPSCLLLAKRLWLSMKTLLLLLTKSHYSRKFCFSVCFRSFFCFFLFCFLTYWDHYEHVYMRTEVNSNQFEISNSFEMSFCLHGNLHGDFTAATCQTIARLYCKWCLLINAKQMLRYWLFSKQ